ncbi:uncharacterized protein LOC119399592 [Rhipicephalus sanguineus]|uniref:uncharacterized protein LOC119399592 n=1 Tax=Rhipicephalus sanguineus TaxID=34632 RepID=UPI0018952D60|nr:uncharacterized protein LOC119399592 [Rhipicephalus sanguineus]
MSPANSNLFTQSEESDCAAGEINDFVTTVVEQLDPQIIIAADREPADQRQDSQGSLSGSATPDNLDLLEGQAQSPDEAPEHPSPEHPSPEHPSSSHEQQGLLAEAARGRFETEEEGPGNLADKAQSAVLRSPSHTSANTSDRPLRIAVLASGTCTPTPGLLGGSEISDGTETVDVRSYCMPPDSSAIKRRTEELTTSCLPGAVSKCIAKKLFANSSACNKALTANSDLPELLDPHELEGMFDEWSEGLDCATRTVNAAGTHECEGESQIPGSHKKHGVGDMSAAAGNCRKSGADHTSVRIMDGELDRAQAADVLSQSLQRRHSELQCNAAAEDDNCENYGQGAEIAQEVECVSPDPVLRSSIEAERKLPSEDQCSQSASSCLGGLSGISRFSDELEEKHAAPHPEDDQKLGCEDLDSPVRSSGGACDGLGEDDHDGAGWDNLDDAYEGQCQGTARPHGSLLGTRNPLLLFCALKCEDEQPVTAVHLVQAAAHPFLVSVQASAINVWHPEEEHGWRHSLVMRRLKFPVEEDHCLLSCEQWTVLVYLNARMPMYLPCLEWRTTDGQDGSQLLLTLGSLGNADGFSLKRSQRIYRIAKLSREGQFATALRTTGGATLLRVHRLRHLRGELGDETDALGRTSNLLDSLVRVEGQPDALLGNSANIFYVWDCNNRVLVKKMIHEPDLFADLQRISWCSSDRGLLFVLMQSSDDVTSTLVAMNPFSCKAEPVISLSWKLAAKVRTGDPRSCSTQVEGRYAACVTPGYGVRIWNLFTGNPVANMWYRGSTSVAIAELSGSMVAAVGLDNGRVLVFTS